ncbi:MAG: hypothetical protein HZA93_03860 [Verrucomicrobia bacterium]|nr:hypothetical protein [Verrucomicrobiota bacterium]
MRYAAAIYFAITGLLFGWQGVRVVTVGGHFGEPVYGMWEEKVLASSVAGDAQKKKDLEEGFRRFQAHLERVSFESLMAGLLLCVASALHLIFATSLFLRLSITDLWRLSQGKKVPNSERSAAPERAAGRGLNKPGNE